MRLDKGGTSINACVCRRLFIDLPSVTVGDNSCGGGGGEGRYIVGGYSGLMILSAMGQDD